MGGDAIYLGKLYKKDQIIRMYADAKNCLNYIALTVQAWEENLCPDCFSPIKTVNYVNKCSAEPDLHSLGDAVFYLKKIKKRLEKDALYTK